MTRYFVSFGQFFEARDKQHAHDKAMQAMWGDGTRDWGVSVEECPSPEVDPSTGVLHWQGADQ